MKNFKYTYIIMLLFAVGAVHAQERIVKKVSKKNYNNLAYVKTSEILLEVAEEGYKSQDLLQKLGNSYYFNNNMKDAAKWYGELMALESKSIDAEYYFRYAQALKGIEKYDESNKWMTKFEEAKPSDLRSRAFASTNDYLSKIDNVSYDNLEVENLDINSKLSDFGSTVFNGNLIFASTRGEGKLYKWNEQPFLDLYYTTKNRGEFTEPSPMSSSINTKYHESSAAFTPDGKYIFFTRNNFFKNRYNEDDERFNRLKIFRAEVTAVGDYDNLKSVHFNNDNYSVAHPAINAKGTKMYFASDMPGTTGASDIYVVDINEDGTLGVPVNLGTNINTEASESFPFVNENGDLYFASNGYPGLGGLDIYVIKDFERKFEESQAQNYIVQNIGKPFNSSQDDFGYYENVRKKEGFFTSNRKGGKGDDDIYAFSVPECKQQLEGVLTEEETKDALSGVTVTLYDASGNVIASQEAGKDGSYSFEISCDKEYLIRVSKPDYNTTETRIAGTNRFEQLTQNLSLTKDVKPISLGDDLAKTLEIPIIYFDFDKHNIRPDAAVELQKVIAVLKKYTTMEIEVKSHTDSRATKSYNNALSTRRNTSTKAYIINQGGIDAKRITGAGYGESQLVNKCSDGVKCSEEEHQLNRRSEFIIVKM